MITPWITLIGYDATTAQSFHVFSGVFFFRVFSFNSFLGSILFLLSGEVALGKIDNWARVAAL